VDGTSPGSCPGAGYGTSDVGNLVLLPFEACIVRTINVLVWKTSEHMRE
jgi:hypothetical protein